MSAEKHPYNPSRHKAGEKFNHEAQPILSPVTQEDRERAKEQLEQLIQTSREKLEE